MSMFDPKKLGEEADQLIQQLSTTKAEAEADDPVAEEVPAEVEEEAPVDEVAEAIVHDEVVEEVDDQGTTDHTDESPSEPVAEGDESLAAMQKQLDAAEQRWKVLQGMINKKDQELDAMRDLFASVSANKQEAKDEAEPAPAPVEPKLTQKDVEEYGGDLVDMVKRAAHDVSHDAMQALLKVVDNRLKQLEGSVQTVEKTTARTAEEVFYDGLSKSVPNWQQLNTDEAFLEWLSQPEPFAGVPRQDLLSDAVQRQDISRTAAFFNTYQSLNSEPETVAEEAEASEEPASKPSDRLAKKVVPGKGRAASPKTAGEKLEWDRKSIAKLYDDKRLGRITPKDFDRLERDLFKAQSEGRIAVS